MEHVECKDKALFLKENSCLSRCPEGLEMKKFDNVVMKCQSLEPWSVGGILYFIIVFDDF